MPPRRSRQSGASLILTMILVTVMGTLSAALFQTSRLLLRESVWETRRTQARAIAEAGIEDALLQLRLNSSWRTGFTQKPFGGGYYTVTLSSASSPAVTSTGWATSVALLGRAHASITVAALITGQSTNACTTLTGDRLTADGVIDSYDSSVNPAPASFGTAVHVCSNDRIVAGTDGGVKTIQGDAEYFQTPAPSATGVQGSIIKSTFTRTVPSYDGSVYISSNSNAALPAANYNASNMRMTIGSGQTVIVPPGIYYLDRLTINNGTLRANTSTGTVTIYLDNALTVSANDAIVNTTQIPSRLRLYPQGNRTWNLSSNTPLHAVIASSLLTLTINQTFYGGVTVDRLTVNSGDHFHWDSQTLSQSTATVTHVSITTGTWSEP